MPDAAATLKDVTSSSQATTTSTESTKAADTTAATTTTTVEVADKDAAELGRTLLDMGVTREQLNDLMQAPQALAAIRYQIENDPQEFIRSLERVNPGAGENFLDKLSKLYVDRYAREGADGKDGKDGAANELQDKLRELTERVTGFETQAQKQANAAAMAAVNARYDARVEDLFGQLPADKVPLTKMEKELIKDALSSRLGRDADAAKRVYNGNFVDVPRAFKGIVEGLLNDRKAAADADKAARERSTRGAFPEIAGGPVELPKDFYDVSNTPVDQIWDEGPLVRILEGR